MAIQATDGVAIYKIVDGTQSTDLVATKIVDLIGVTGISTVEQATSTLILA